MLENYTKHFRAMLIYFEARLKNFAEEFFERVTQKLTLRLKE